jgi:LysR family glycine cleavage system transcriptional activator
MQLPMRAICVFHAAAKAGSVSKAAAELNVTPSAVTQQIQLLELQLGTSLMVKVGRRIAHRSRRALFHFDPRSG